MQNIDLLLSLIVKGWGCCFLFVCFCFVLFCFCLFCLFVFLGGVHAQSSVNPSQIGFQLTTCHCSFEASYVLYHWWREVKRWRGRGWYLYPVVRELRSYLGEAQLLIAPHVKIGFTVQRLLRKLSCMNRECRIQNREFLAVHEACKALFWLTPGLKRTFNSSVLFEEGTSFLCPRYPHRRLEKRERISSLS